MGRGGCRTLKRSEALIVQGILSIPAFADTIRKVWKALSINFRDKRRNFFFMKCLSSSRFKTRQLGWRPSSQVVRHQVTNIMVTITVTLVIAITTMVLTITMVINTMVFMITGEYKEECGTCALIAEGSTMPFSDNTCPQVAQKHTHTHTHKHTLTQSNIKNMQTHTWYQSWPRKNVFFQCGADTTQLTEGEQNPVWIRPISLSALEKGFNYECGHHLANRGGTKSCLKIQEAK